eukprot:scaffold38409_cov57-Phaeocystis_antarctica.AAC.2
MVLVLCGIVWPWLCARPCLLTPQSARLTLISVRRGRAGALRPAGSWTWRRRPAGVVAGRHRRGSRGARTSRSQAAWARGGPRAHRGLRPAAAARGVVAHPPRSARARRAASTSDSQRSQAASRGDIQRSQAASRGDIQRSQGTSRGGSPRSQAAARSAPAGAGSGRLRWARAMRARPRLWPDWAAARSRCR